MWELKLKLQRAEDACTAAEEKTLCLESFVREGVSNVGRVMPCHVFGLCSYKMRHCQTGSVQGLRSLFSACY